MGFRGVAQWIYRPDQSSGETNCLCEASNSCNKFIALWSTSVILHYNTDMPDAVQATQDGTMKPIKIAGLTVIFAATALAGCNSGKASVARSDLDSAPTPLPVHVTMAETMDIHAAYHAASAIVADAEAPILARIDGQIVEILVEEGDSVSKGQILARLDGDRLRLEMRQAQANLEKMTREYDRLTDLHQKGLVSATSFDGLGFDRDAQRALYELTKLNYHYAEIRATIAGVVSSRNVKVGTNVSSGDPVFTVSDTARLVSYLNIPQTELTKFSAGHTATLLVDAMPDILFQANVVRISPTIDASDGTFRATLFIDNQDGQLAPGMFGRFTIAYEKHSNALVIPAAAIVREDNEAIVYVVTNGAAIRRPIELGIQADGQVEVLSGLEKDEKIVIAGHGGLRDGSLVQASLGVTNSTSG